MFIPRHEIVGASQNGFTPRRAIAIGSVGLLHVAVIYALIVGMTPTVVKLVAHDIIIDMVASTTPSPPVQAPPQPTMAHPTDTATLDPKAPTYTIADDNRTAIATTGTSSHPPVADSGAAGVGSTHSTPPYPLEARNLSHQGTVLLQLTISPQGDVTVANIVRSSGFAELDGAAVSWVLAHWKYKPAIQGGVAVTSQTQAAVKFDLKQTRG